jgi:4-hydroxy-tetrahydrodipicolinate synthase
MGNAVHFEQLFDAHMANIRRLKRRESRHEDREITSQYPNPLNRIIWHSNLKRDMESSLKPSLRDVAAGVLTPFEDDGTIRHADVEANARYLWDRGVRVFLGAANVSEFHALTHTERIDVVASVTDAVPDEATVLAGAGGSIETVLELDRAASENGADAVMLMPPDHTFLHREGLIEYYERIGSASELPLVPYLRGLDLTPETVAGIAECSNVVAIKYALEDVSCFANAVDTCDADVVWINGMAEPYAPSLWAEGARGFTSGVGNFRPSLSLALYRALDAGEWDRARTLRNATFPFQSYRAGAGDGGFPGANSVPALKIGLESVGLYGGPVRPPIASLSEAEARRARELADEVGSFVDEHVDPSPRAAASASD